MLPSPLKVDRAHSKRYLSLCVIVRDEDAYIREWVAFHLAVGADFILILDNGQKSEMPRLLARYIAEGLVEVRKIRPQSKAQREGYNRALRYLESKTEWVGFIDIDEFVFPVAEKNLKSVLKDYEDYGGLAVNWVSFGSSGHVAAPIGWVTKNFVERGPLDHIVELPQLAAGPNPVAGSESYRPINCHVKCFVRPSATISFRTAHHFRYRDGQFAVTENFKRIDGPFSDEVSVRRIRINHYWSKSLEELRAKLEKGRISQATRKESSGYALELSLIRERASGGIQDFEVFRFIEKAESIDSAYPMNDDFAKPLSIRPLRFSPIQWFLDREAKFRQIIRTIARRLSSVNEN